MLLEWRHPQAKLDSYRLVYESADGHRGEKVLPADLKSHSLAELRPGTLYSVSISAERGSRSSAPTTVSASTGWYRPLKHQSQRSEVFTLNKEEESTRWCVGEAERFHPTVRMRVPVKADVH